jgi:membrane-associated protein
VIAVSTSAIAAALWAGAEVGAGYAAATFLPHVFTFGVPVLGGILAVAAAAALWLRARARRAALRVGSAPAHAGARLPSSRE